MVEKDHSFLPLTDCPTNVSEGVVIAQIRDTQIASRLSIGCLLSHISMSGYASEMRIFTKERKNFMDFLGNSEHFSAKFILTDGELTPDGVINPTYISKLTELADGTTILMLYTSLGTKQIRDIWKDLAGYTSTPITIIPATGPRTHL